MAKRKSRPMTEHEYLAEANRLLKDATPIGAYCLGFAEALRHKAKRSPPIEVMERLVKCQTIGEGVSEYEACLRYLGKED